MDTQDVELGCKWNFPDMPSNCSLVGPNEPMTENFKKNPYESLVREAIQNSLDERLDKSKPLEMEFSIKKLNLDEFPNFSEIYDHLIGCKKFSDKAAETYTPMIDYLDMVRQSPDKSMYYIQVSDYNANGMPFNENNPYDPQSPFVAFVRSAGVSKKRSETSGGSFGFGKAAYFNFSPIRTIIVSTLTKDNKYYFEGVSSLCSHEYNGVKKMHIGYYDSNNGLPISNLESIPKCFRRATNDEHSNSFGTDIFIMGLRVYSENAILAIYYFMIKSILQNFWMAIYEGILSVKLDSHPIKKENILSMMEMFFKDPDDNSKRITDYNPLPYLKMVINAKRGEKDHKIFTFLAGNSDPDNSCVLYLQKKKTANDRILFMRSPRMLVKAETKRNRRGYYGVFICKGGRWDSLLRSIENPAHNEWNADNFDGDKQTSREIKDFLRDVFKFVREKVDELFSSTNSSEDTIKDLEQYLYIPTDVDDEDDDDFAQESLISNPTGDVKDDGTSMTSDSEQVPSPEMPVKEQQIGVVLRPIKSTTEVNPHGEQLSGRGSEKKRSNSGGSKGNRRIYQREVIVQTQDAHPTITLSRIPVRYRSFAQMSNGSIIHKLIIHSDCDIDNGRIDLSVGTEDKAEQIIIRDSNPGIARDNTIIGLKLLANQPNEITVRFADNMKHSIILEAYEIK